MTDRDCLTDPLAQHLRGKMVDALGSYRVLVPHLPAPAYVKDAITQAVAALDRWTRDSIAAQSHHA